MLRWVLFCAVAVNVAWAGSGFAKATDPVKFKNAVQSFVRGRTSTGTDRVVKLLLYHARSLKPFPLRNVILSPVDKLSVGDDLAKMFHPRDLKLVIAEAEQQAPRNAQRTDADFLYWEALRSFLRFHQGADSGHNFIARFFGHGDHAWSVRESNLDLLNFEAQGGITDDYARGFLTQAMLTLRGQINAIDRGTNSYYEFQKGAALQRWYKVLTDAMGHLEDAEMLKAKIREGRPKDAASSTQRYKKTIVLLQKAMAELNSTLSEIANATRRTDSAQ